MKTCWILLFAWAVAAASVFAAGKSAEGSKAGATTAAVAQGSGAEDAPDMPEAEVLALLQKSLPASKKALDELKTQDKEAYDEELQEWAYDLSVYKEALEDNPEYAEKELKKAGLNSSARIAAGQCRRASTREAKDAARGKLRTIVNESFTAQLTDMENEIRSHEEEIRNLKQRIAKRKAEQQAVIEKRITALINQEEYPSDWDSGDEEEGAKE